MEQVYDVIANKRHYTITQAQVDACERVVDPETRIVHYSVKSASTPGTVYKVFYDRRFGRIACNCPAFYYPTCWHRRAAVKAEELFKQELRAQYEAAKKEIETSAEYRMEVSKHTAEQALVSYHEALREAAGAGDEAAKRELKAFRKHGNKAYESEGFNLLK